MANLVVAVSIVLTGTTVLWLSKYSGVAVPVWPSAGLSVVCLLKWGPALLPGVMAGAFATNLIDLISGSASVRDVAVLSALLAAASSLQAVVGAWMVKRWVGANPSLASAREILLFMGLAGPLSCVIAASLGVSTLVIAGVLPAAEASQETLVWWVGDSIGVIVFAPILLMSLPDQAVVWRGRRWVVALPSMLLTILAVAVFLQEGHLNQRQLVSALDRVADRAANALQTQLSCQEELLYAVRGFIAGSQYVSRNEFRTFVFSILEKSDGLVALSWNPLVTRGQRPAFEEHLREEYADSTLGIRERRGGRLQPAEDRPSHVAVELIEPFAQNQGALGYDIQSDPIRRQALQEAGKHRTVQATAPIKLVQSNQTRLAMLKVLPVFCTSPGIGSFDESCSEPRGFVVGVVKVEDLFASTFSAPFWQEVNLQLKDVTIPEDTITIAGMPSKQDAAALTAGSGTQQNLLQSRRFQQAGRLWELEARPMPAFFERQPASWAAVLLVAALILVALLEALLLLITGVELDRRRQLEQKLRLSLVTAGLAHEVKQPLALLRLQARKIQQLTAADRNRERNPDLDQTIEDVNQSCRTLTNLIAKVQQLLAHGSTEAKELDLSELVRDVHLAMKSEATRRGIQLDMRGFDQPLPLVGDAGQLKLALLNLLRNSLDAMEATPGGVIETSLERTRDWLILRVSDSGPGFEVDPGGTSSSPLLFNSSKPDGMGIGLFLVRAAVDHHGGWIHFGRAREGGALVEIGLPAQRLVRAR